MVSFSHCFVAAMVPFITCKHFFRTAPILSSSNVLKT